MTDHPDTTVTVTVGGVVFDLVDLARSGGMAGTYAVFDGDRRIGNVLSHRYPVDESEARELIEYFLDDLVAGEKRTLLS